MLTISRALHAKILAHARADHPDEACGVIAGPAGRDRPERFIPMANAERSPTFYRFDSMEQLSVWREMDDRDEEPVAHRHRGLSVPHRHRVRERARRALCTRIHPRAR
jgi:proteasome lid subunit RPN8/RPN11